MTMYENEATIIQGCLKKLEEVGEVEATLETFEDVMTGIKVDGRLKVQDDHHQGRMTEFFVEVKKRLTGPQVDHIAYQMKNYTQKHLLGVPGILLAKYVPPRAAERLREEDIQFVDTAGNMFLQLPWQKIFIMGYQPEDRKPVRTTLTNTGALKIIFTLLAHPEAATWPQRQIAVAAGVALGGVGPVIRELRANEFLELRRREMKKIRMLVNTDKLLAHWLANYEPRLRRRQHIGVYRILGGNAVTDLMHLLEAKLTSKIWIGGELGATLLEQNELRPAAATLHIGSSVDIKRLAMNLQMVPDKSGNVHILRTFGTCNGMEGQEDSQFRLADPLLLYAELLQIDDQRAKIFARHFYEARIAGRHGQ